MTVWYAGAYACAYQTVIYTLLYQCDTWFMSLCVDDRLVCVPDGHLHIIVSLRHLVYVTLCR